MPSKIGSGGFTRLLASAGSKEVLSPLLRAYLFNPDFPEFEVKVDSWKSRPPDGWFHPSTHPSWTERMLYYYLTQPDLMLAEPFQINDVMAILQGNIWHVFIQKCLMEMGVLTGVEVEVEDPETRARGSMDGLTNPDKLPIDEPEVWEFKTMHPRKLSKLAKGAPDSEEVVESFKADNWEYYLQGQEYMRLSGYTRWRGLILGLVNPFPMREVVMEYDPALGATIGQRYRSVLDHVEHDQPPQPCCAPLSKEAQACPARQTCPVGML